MEVAGTDDVYAWDVVREHEGFERHTLFPERSYNSIPPGEIRRRVQKTLDEVAPAAVVINGWGVPEAIAALQWCHRQGAKAILTSESLPPERPAIWKEALKSLRIRRFDAALVGGRPHAHYVKSLGMPAERIFLGYDAVDNDYFQRETDARRMRQSDLRDRYDLPSRYFYANTRFLARKNLPACVQAFGLAVGESEAKDWHLVITGSGEDEDDVRKAIAKAGIEDRVHLPGFVQYADLPTYYGLASAFIHPALTEAWGLVLNEAAASGLPILSSLKVGAAHELLMHGENGWLFDPSSVESMARAMLLTMEATPEERERMGQVSRGIVEKWGPCRFAEGCLCALETAGAIRHRQGDAA